MGEGGAQFLCRASGFDSLAALQHVLQARYEVCGQIIARAFEEEAPDAGCD